MTRRAGEGRGIIFTRATLKNWRISVIVCW